MANSILLVGVGGQGTILISKILTAGLTQLGYQVKMSEIHGMSQRGGSVSTQIKYGESVYAPNIGLAEADMVISFEKAEALRALPFLKKGGTLITDEREIYPMPVLSGAEQYPHGAIDEIKKHVEHVLVIKAAETAETGKTIWRCIICGYEYEGEELPADFICPLCKHPASDFEKVLV